jgi:DNA-binding transcriptional ArsR family regulator
METLSKLFGWAGRVKLMRLFLFNPELLFTVEQIADKAKISLRETEVEIDILKKAGLIKSRKTVQTVSFKKRGKVLEKKKKVLSWLLDPNFEYLSQMQNLLINSRPLRKEEILKRLHNVGKLKMVIVAGVFIQDPDSRVDLLIVGDNLKRGSIDRIVKTMESEIGKELTFASFETTDFNYRLGMYDKLIRDILDYPHQKLLDKLNIALNPKTV